ncbi:hypothetical protein NL676_022089 [Syzygium grande]|nr:hypothetical protein NL676_022089 [Syzygium grande]
MKTIGPALPSIYLDKRLPDDTACGINLFTPTTTSTVSARLCRRLPCSAAARPAPWSTSPSAAWPASNPPSSLSSPMASPSPATPSSGSSDHPSSTSSLAISWTRSPPWRPLSSCGAINWRYSRAISSDALSCTAGSTQ